MRFVWWMEDEWRTRLSSYYEHLVQPGRSVLGKRNYFGPKFVNWLTRLCATQTISSGVIRTQCVLQIPKACKEMSLACSLRWRVDVSVASPIIFSALFALFGLRCLRCRGYGMRLHNRISIAQSLRALKLPNCRCLAALKIIWHCRRKIWPDPRQNRQIWRDWNNNSNVNKYQCLGELIPERKFQLLKRGATSPGGVF